MRLVIAMNYRPIGWQSIPFSELSIGRMNTKLRQTFNPTPAKWKHPNIHCTEFLEMRIWKMIKPANKTKVRMVRVHASGSCWCLFPLWFWRGVRSPTGLGMPCKTRNSLTQAPSLTRASCGSYRHAAGRNKGRAGVVFTDIMRRPRRSWRVAIPMITPFYTITAFLSNPVNRN